MTRDEAMKWVGKFVKIIPVENTGSAIVGHFMLNKVNNGVLAIRWAEKCNKVYSEEIVVSSFDKCSYDLQDVVSICEVKEDCVGYKCIPIHDYFGHEIGDWLSKPIDQKNNKQEDHQGMIYNKFTNRWTWF